MREKTLIKNEEDVSTVRSVTNWTDKSKTSRGTVHSVHTVHTVHTVHVITHLPRQVLGVGVPMYSTSKFPNFNY